MPGLWSRYMALQRGNFVEFRVAGLQAAFGEAVAAMGTQAERCVREASPHAEMLKVGSRTKTPWE